jgi:F420-0:gamma-glutamyl ligase
MKFLKIKTRAFLPPQDSIWSTLERLKIKDGDIIAITSKILAIHQGRTFKMHSDLDKRELIRKEAEHYIWSESVGPNKKKFMLTIKDHTLVASAGIDESNANGYYILWPKDAVKLLKAIHLKLCRRFKIKNLGIISTDSHIIPMRQGVVGISTAFYGFNPQKDYRGRPDIFGRKLKFTQGNIVDSLAAIAVHLMGEGNEQTPIIIIRNSEVRFTKKDMSKALVMPLKKDLYYPILKVFKKR